MKKNTGVILAVIGGIGVIYTTILGIKATPKAIILLDKRKKELEVDELDGVEIIKTTWKCYIPTAISCITSLSCIVGSSVLGHKRQASLISAYAFINDSYNRYRRSVNSVYGEGADSAILAHMAEEKYISDSVWGNVIYRPDDDGSEDVLFYDQIENRYFTSKIASVLTAMYHVNRNLTIRGYVTLDEYYDFLGIDTIENGDILGWCMEQLDGASWLDFDNKLVKMDDGLECYILSPFIEPEIIDDEYR